MNGSERLIVWFDEDFGSVLSIDTDVAWSGTGKTVSDAFRCNIGLSNDIELKSTPSKSVVFIDCGAEKVGWVSIFKSNKSFSVFVNVVGWDWGWFVSSPVISRRVPTAMSSFVCDSCFNRGFTSVCCSWNGLGNDDEADWGVGDERRFIWGEDGLLTLALGWITFSLAEGTGDEDSDV